MPTTSKPSETKETLPEDINYAGKEYLEGIINAPSKYVNNPSSYKKMVGYSLENIDYAGKEYLEEVIKG